MSRLPPRSPLPPQPLTQTPYAQSRNNHLKQHREQLRDAANKFSPPARLLALNWSFDLPLSTIHRICGDRIVARGTNHQTLHADLSARTHEEVIWQFLKNAEELEDAEADAVVSMNVEEPLEDALARAAGAVARLLGREQPDAERMGLALAAARAYEPHSRGGKKSAAGSQAAGRDKAEKAEQAQSSKKAKKANSPPRYYGILAEVDLEAVVGPAIADAVAAGDLPTEARGLWDGLVREKRVQTRPHVTVVHSKELPAQNELWERCHALDALPHPPLFSFRLGHVVWSERIMAATVVDLAVAADGDAGDVEKEAVQFVRHLPDEVRRRLHITVGTRDKGVPPVEAKDLVIEWKRDAKAHPGVWAVPLKDVCVKGRVKGLNN